MHSFLKNALLVLLSLALSVIALEALSRAAYPVQYGNHNTDADGHPVFPAVDFLGVVPSLTYRQQAQEYDVLTTHTDRGFRGPAGGFMDKADPEILFLGDSMAYGVGLTDDQTIPYQYCQSAGKTCANLGRPGIGTSEAIDILENRLEKDGWRPLDVKLLMNVMTAAQFGGNDLTDTLTARDRKVREQAARLPAPNDAVHVNTPAMPLHPNPYHISKAVILERSNLARVGYFIFAPMLRSLFSPGLDAAWLQESLSLTHDELARLETLSQRYAFTYTLYIVHPMQDLSRKTWQTTRKDIQDIAGSARVVDTAPALLDRADPVSYYYPLDGHVRPEGAARIAAYMLERDKND